MTRSQAKPAMGVFDLGASGGRFFAATIEGQRMTVDELHRFEHRPEALYVSGAGAGAVRHLYWDVFSQYEGLITGLGRAGDRGYRITSVGIDTWGTDGLWLGASGEPLGNAFCYRDHRLDAVRAELFARVSERTLFDRTGIPSHPFTLINQLFWAVRNRRELVDAAEVFVPIPSLFTYYLTGRKVTEYTWISTTQCCRAGTGEYCDETFRELGLPLDKMPPVERTGTRLGPAHTALTDELGTDGFEVVLTAGHDTACAFVAAPVAADRATLIVSSGTWSLVGMNIAKPIGGDAVFESRFTNEGGVEGIRFLNNIMGTWLLQELRRIWAEQDGRDVPWVDIERMIETARPARSFIDPDDLSFYNPPDMAEAIAAFCRRTGQAVPEGRADVARTATESLALKTAWACRTVERLTKQTIEAVHIVGGGARSKVLNQMIANATGLAVQAGPYDATAVGNALVQAVALGELDSYEQGRRVVAESFESRHYVPTDADHWREAGERFAGMTNDEARMMKQ